MVFSGAAEPIHYPLGFPGSLLPVFQQGPETLIGILHRVFGMFGGIEPGSATPRTAEAPVISHCPRDRGANSAEMI